MSDQQQGPGWWLASDGRWYPPDQAPAVPSPETWSTPPPGPPPRSGMSSGAIVALSIAGVVGVLALIFGAIAFVGSSAESSFSSAATPLEGSGDDDPEGTIEPAAVPEGFAVIEGKGVSIAAPSRWRSLDAEDLAMGSDEFQAAFPDAPPELVEQGLNAIDQGAVLVAFDFGGASFASNVNVIEAPGEAPLEAIEDQAAQQLGTLGGEVLESGIVELLGDDALRIEYTLSVATPGGASVPAAGVQYYVPRHGRTFVVTVTAADDVTDLADRMIQTFRVT